MNWEVILWTCITVAVLLLIISIFFSVLSAVNMRKRRDEMKELHTALKVGSNVIFAGGLYGKIVKINNDKVSIELNKGNIVVASRFSIQGIEDNK